MIPLEVRPAVAADAPAISALIVALAPRFIVDPEGRGAGRFLAMVAPEAVAGCLADPTFDYRVGEVDGALAGVAALRDGSHLYHLFVADPFRGRGIARVLWETLRAAAPEPRGPFTVHATPNAVPVYAAFGFQATGPRTEANGIAFVPMRREADGATQTSAGAPAAV
ncbi:MAG: GNAT family N-acetyltransferase [Gammaproteobacteria bacterium]|nr:GNAT family N-acetyltransferase [Gammaproteobacteria bacterium]